MHATDHLDPFAHARRIGETATDATGNRASRSGAHAVGLGSPAETSSAVIPPSTEKTMPDGFSPISDGEGEILSLLHRFLDICATIDNFEDRDDNREERNAIDREWNHLFRAICEVPAKGAVGLAIKAFLVGIGHASTCLGRLSQDYGDYDADGWLDMGLHAFKRLIDDAVRFVPELAPMAELVTSSPVRLSKPGTEETVETLAEAPDRGLAGEPARSPEFGPLPGNLAAAEREIADLRARSKALEAGTTDDLDKPIWDRIWALECWICAAAPATLAEAAIKLRRLADPDLGIDAGTAEGDALSLRQVLAHIERASDQEYAVDEVVVSVFRRWREDLETADTSSDENGDVVDAAAETLADTIHELAETPARGAVGLALKAYATIYQACDLRQGQAGALGRFDEDRYGPDGRLYLSLSLIKGLLTDAARLVPELVPLAAPVIAADDGAVRSVFSESERRLVELVVRNVPEYQWALPFLTEQRTAKLAGSPMMGDAQIAARKAAALIKAEIPSLTPEKLLSLAAQWKDRPRPVGEPEQTERMETIRELHGRLFAADAEWCELVSRVDALPKPRVLDRWVREEADIDEAIDKAITARRFSNLLESVGELPDGNAPPQSCDELEAMRGPLKAQHAGAMAEWAKQHEPLDRRVKELIGQRDALTSAIDETPVCGLADIAALVDMVFDQQGVSVECTAAHLIRELSELLPAFKFICVPAD